MITSKSSKLTSIFYNTILKLFTEGIYQSSWLSNIKDILDKNGFGDAWLRQTELEGKLLMKLLEQKFNDIYAQEWTSGIENNISCTNYMIFKEVLSMESYLNILSPKARQIVSMFRCRSLRFPVHKTGQNACTKCNSGDVGDEYHYLFECARFKTERIKYLGDGYCKSANTLKMKGLLTCTDTKQLYKLAKFMSSIFKELK